MSLFPMYPAGLGQADFSRIRFGLDMLDSCRLAPVSLLGLRRPMQQAAAAMLGPAASQLFNPPLSTDPLALRRHQKPAPGFVVHVSACAAEQLQEGDRVDLELLLLGTATHSLGDFVKIIRQLGGIGLCSGEGHFELAEVSCLGADGSAEQPSRAGHQDIPVVPVLLRLDHWLEDHWPDRTPVTIEFLTPLRLLAQGRVLRRPRFEQLFPFLLRRVTSLLHAHCGVEMNEEPALLLRAASDCRATWLDLRWCDWRETGPQTAVGGLLGSLQIDGDKLDRILWVLMLAALFGAGKGAAYGAGRCQLHDAR